MQGKVALVTGGTSGIGLATAAILVQRGAQVIVVGRNIERGEQAVTHLSEEGGKASFMPADVTQPAQVEQVINQIIANYGRLDYAVNNAGDTGAHGFVHEVSEADFDETMNVNVKSVWLCMKYEVPPMLAQGYGSIVNVTSVKGLTGSQHALYSAAKHAVHGLVKSAATAYATKGVRVNAVAPAAIETPLLAKALQPVFDRPTAEERFAEYGAMLPIGRTGHAEEVAEAVVWLCSDAASFVTGHILAVDGGSTAKGIP